MKTKRLTKILALTLIAAFVFSWASHTDSQDGYEYFTALVGSSADSPAVTVPATIRGSSQYEVYSKTSGTVTSVGVQIGDKVKVGQPLLVLDGDPKDIDLYRQLSELKDELKTTDRVQNALKQLRKLSRQPSKRSERRLVEDEVVSLLRDYLSYDGLLSEFKKRSLDRLVVAPQDGVVVSLEAKVGMLVDERRQETPLAVIGQDFQSKQVDLVADIEIPEEIAYRVHSGQRVELRLPFSEGKAANARITQVSQATVVKDKRKFVPAIAEVIAPFDASHFRYGVSALAEVDLGGTPGGAVVPISALELKVAPNTVKRRMDLSQSGQAERTKVSERTETKPSPDWGRTPAGKAAAITMQPRTTLSGTVYLLTEENQVVEVTATVLSRNSNTAVLASTDLVGYRVITHMRKRLGSLASLLQE